MADRDWRAYNEALVRRGEVLLDMAFLKGWSRELRRMNRGKEGARYRHSRVLHEAPIHTPRLHPAL
jgi:hypothetical protein